MHDEAATHYISMVPNPDPSHCSRSLFSCLTSVIFASSRFAPCQIDQTTLGHRLIRDEFGDAARPTVGWQVQTHSLFFVKPLVDVLFFIVTSLLHPTVGPLRSLCYSSVAPLRRNGIHWPLLWTHRLSRH